MCENVYIPNIYISFKIMQPIYMYKYDKYNKNNKNIRIKNDFIHFQTVLLIVYVSWDD